MNLTVEEVQSIWNNWIDLWNGNPARAEQIIASDFTLHMSSWDGTDVSKISTPQAFATWVKRTLSAFRPLKYTEQFPPIFQRDIIAGRWLATGNYLGGMPGAKAAPGTLVSFAGADFLRIKDGKIVEYWLSADILDMLAQLKMLG